MEGRRRQVSLMGHSSLIGVGRQTDHDGWQKVQHWRPKRQGAWTGGKTMDVASRNRTSGDEKRSITSFYFTNFPDRFKARDMYDCFSIHGRVLEVVIPARKEERRKRFGFVRFLNVQDPDNLAMKLDNVFVEGMKLHVNLPRFSRDQDPVTNHKKEMTYQKEGRDHIEKPLTKKVWVQKQTKVEDHEGGGYKEALLRGIAKEKVISYEVKEESFQKYVKAMVGEVFWPGKSYSIQNEFIRQGFFFNQSDADGSKSSLIRRGKG